MKRASIREAIEWIADNDDAATGPDVEAIDSYISTKLVADIFGLDSIEVAKRVAKVRADAICADENCDESPDAPAFPGFVNLFGDP